jgi:hypothetical protein
MQSIQTTLHAMLVHPEADMDKISRQMMIPKDVLQCYEKLFFNVLDRRTECAWLASVVFPNTRLVEVFADYAKKTGMGSLLMRSGYTLNVTETAYWAGLPNDLMETYKNSGEMAGKFEAVMMASGYITAKLGMLNQSSHVAAAGIGHARNLLAAAKQGGQTTGDNDPLEGLSKTLSDEINLVKRRQLQYSQVLEIEVE